MNLRAAALVLLLAAPPASAELGMGAAVSWRLLSLEHAPTEGSDAPRAGLSAAALGLSAQISLDGLWGADPQVVHAGRPGSWLRLTWLGPAALSTSSPSVTGVELLASVDMEDDAPEWSWSLETAFAWRSFRSAAGTEDHWTPFHAGAALTWRPGGVAWFAVGARVDPVLLAAVGLQVPELLLLRAGFGGTGLEGAAFGRGGVSLPMGHGTELFVVGEVLGQGALEEGRVTSLRSLSLQAGCAF